MNHDASDSRPLDLSDLREADTLGQSWDAWLRDDIEPTRHQIGQSLAAGIAATVEDLYDRDDTPAPAATFRRSLKRDLLHMHDALGASSAPETGSLWPPSPLTGPLGAAADPSPDERRSRPRRWRLLRRWWPAMEFAAAAVLILALFGVTFGNARIAEFFRDDESGNFAAQGDPDVPDTDPSAPVTIEQGWLNVIRDDAGVGLRPYRITVAEGYAAVVSDHYESGSITLTVFDANGGERLWTANVNTGMYSGIQGQDSTPVITDGRLYLLNRAGFLYGFDIATYPDDPAGLIASVQFPFAATSGDLVLRDGVLYAAGGDTSEADWNLPSMVEHGGSLFIAGDSVDSVGGFDVTSNTFLPQWYGQTIASNVPQGEGFEGNGLWRLDLASGTVTQAWQAPEYVVRHVAMLSNGLLAVSHSANGDRVREISFHNAADINTEVYRYTPAAIDGLWDHRAFPAGPVAVLMTSPPEAPQELLAIDPLNPEAAVLLPWDYTNAPSKPDPAIGGTSSIVVSDDDILRVYDPLTGVVLGQTPIGFQNGEINALTVVDDVVYAAFEDGTVAQFTLVPNSIPAPASAPTPTVIPSATAAPTPEQP